MEGASYLLIYADERTTKDKWSLSKFSTSPTQRVVEIEEHKTPAYTSEKGTRVKSVNYGNPLLNLVKTPSLQSWSL